MNRDQLASDLAVLLSEFQRACIGLTLAQLKAPRDREFLQGRMLDAISTGVADIETLLHDHGVLLNRDDYD